MAPSQTTCAGCGRAMWTKDVDKDGRCPDCPAPTKGKDGK